MIAIPGALDNKETSKEIRNRKICTRQGSREQGQRWQGLDTKASSLPPLPPAHETNPVRGNAPRGTESGALVYARHPERNSSLPHYVRYTSLLPLLKSPTVSHTAARALPKETGIKRPDRSPYSASDAEESGTEESCPGRPPSRARRAGVTSTGRFRSS